MQVLNQFLIWVSKDVGPWGPIILWVWLSLFRLYQFDGRYHYAKSQSQYVVTCFSTSDIHMCSSCSSCRALAYIPITILAIPSSILTVLIERLYTLKILMWILKLRWNSILCSVLKSVAYFQLGGGYLFGLMLGFATDSFGSTLGATAAFMVGRTVSSWIITPWISYLFNGLVLHVFVTVVQYGIRSLYSQVDITRIVCTHCHWVVFAVRKVIRDVQIEGLSPISSYCSCCSQIWIQG